MILAKTRYKIHNSKLLVIVGVFKTWKHYLEDYKHKILILIDYNNSRQFINTKNLSSRQFCWVQKLFYYHFTFIINKIRANITADASFQYS